MKTSRTFVLVGALFPFTAALVCGQNAGATAGVVVVATPGTSVPGTSFNPPVTAVAPATTTPPAIFAPSPNVEAMQSISGETTITLDVGFGIRAVAPSRVTVPTGEKLRIVGPLQNGQGNYIWTKNGRAIPGATDNVLIIDHVLSGDAGTYACQFSTPTTLPLPSQALILGVGPTDRLLNLSTRATIGGSDTLTNGFVVAAGAQSKKLIIRAVGPSLSIFGVTNPLRAPILRIFDGNGQPYNNGYAYPAVVGGPTYESDLADSLARAGAFPLPAGTRDAVLMMPFNSGTYTAQVTSGDGTGGAVLLEIYEVP